MSSPAGLSFRQKAAKLTPPIHSKETKTPMNNKPLLAVTLAMTALSPMPASAEDPHPGRGLHDRNCQSCHDNQVYTRDKRMVTDIDGLRTQVTRCETNLGLQWFDDQKDSVVRYLNDSYYHF
jgi:hypothetical protein